MKEVALELIKMDMPNLRQVEYDGNTALILACKNRMTEVALELIKTGNAKPEHIAKDGTTVLSLARRKRYEKDSK